MEIFEKIKRARLNFALDEPFDIFRIIGDVEDYQPKNSLEVQQLTLETINKLVDTGYFEVAEWNKKKETYEPLNLPIEQIIKNIKSRWDHYGLEWEDIIDKPDMWLYLALTERGEEAAKNFVKREVRAAERVLLKHEELSLWNIMNIVGEEFRTNDLEEICFETLGIAGWLLVHAGYSEVGSLKEGVFSPWNCGEIDARRRLASELKTLVHEPKPEEVSWFRNTQEANDLIQKWEREGGSLCDLLWVMD